MGQPVFFLRLAGCNLHCKWCDTWYTWNYEGTTFNPEHEYSGKVKQADEVKHMSPEEVAEKLEQMFKDFGVTHLVISGGEPMIQQDELAELCKKLKESYHHWFIEIETNGTVTPLSKLDIHVDQYNCSPKLENSGNNQKLRFQKAALAELSSKDNCYFKFVVSKPEDLNEVLGLVSSVDIRHDMVYLMPLGHTRDIQELNSKDVVKMCIDCGFNYSPRLHIEIWDNKRGV